MPPKIRVLFLEPPAFEPVANIWVGVVPIEAGIEAKLLFDYGDDLKPAPGWRIDWDGRLFEIGAVDGPRLKCVDLS